MCEDSERDDGVWMKWGRREKHTCLGPARTATVEVRAAKASLELTEAPTAWTALVRARPAKAEGCRKAESLTFSYAASPARGGRRRDRGAKMVESC